MTMGLFSMIKRNSKLALRESWGRAAIMLIIIIGVSSLISVLQQAALNIFVVRPILENPPPPPEDISPAGIFAYFMSALPPAEWIIIAAFSILVVLIVNPLSLGVTRWFYNLAHGRSMNISEAFHYYESGRLYWRAVWYNVNIAVRGWLWSIVFFTVPCGILFASVYFLTLEDTSRAAAAISTAGIFISIALFALATLFYSVCVYRYALAPYLMADDGDMSAGKAIKTSIVYTKGYRFSLVWFSLSYIGWFLLTVFFIPIFYVWPYYSTGIAMYARFIIEKNRYSGQDATKEFSAPPEAALSGNEPDADVSEE